MRGVENGALNANRPVENADQGRCSVGRAGGVGRDVAARLEFLFIGADEDGIHAVAFCGCGDDDALSAGDDVHLRFLRIRVEAGGFDHDVHSEIFPRQFRRVLLREDGHLLAADHDRALGGFHREFRLLVDAVVLQ